VANAVSPRLGLLREAVEGLEEDVAVLGARGIERRCDDAGARARRAHGGDGGSAFPLGENERERRVK
jgi:hypothetical protein